MKGNYIQVRVYCTSVYTKYNFQFQEESDDSYLFQQISDSRIKINMKTTQED